MADTVTIQKRITCPECKGNGHITLTRMYNDYCGIGSEPCKNCNATGFLEVPMTNADRIRAMSDEELADWLARTQIDNFAEALKIVGIPWEQHPDLRELTGKDNLEWLKQPADDR